MNKFALFTFDQYYPAGGWNDLESFHATKEEALLAAHGDFWQIVNMETLEIVCEKKLERNRIYS